MFKTRRILQLIVGALSILTVLALICLSVVIGVVAVFPEISASANARLDVYRNGLHLIAGYLNLGQSYIVPLLMYVLPSLLLVTGGIMLIWKNGKQPMYITALSLVAAGELVIAMFSILCAGELVGENATALICVCVLLLAVYGALISCALCLKPKKVGENAETVEEQTEESTPAEAMPVQQDEEATVETVQNEEEVEDIDDEDDEEDDLDDEDLDENGEDELDDAELDGENIDNEEPVSEELDSDVTLVDERATSKEQETEETVANVPVADIDVPQAVAEEPEQEAVVTDENSETAPVIEQTEPQQSQTTETMQTQQKQSTSSEPSLREMLTEIYSKPQNNGTVTKLDMIQMLYDNKKITHDEYVKLIDWYFGK